MNPRSKALKALAEAARLIERLEAATGPSRELDIRIEAALGMTTDGVPWTESDIQLALGPHGPDSAATHFAQPYTSSIDAALTLVPDGCWWAIITTHGGYQAEVRSRGIEPLDWVTASTAAIALCISALRARAALTQEPQP